MHFLLAVEFSARYLAFRANPIKAGQLRYKRHKICPKSHEMDCICRIPHHHYHRRAVDLTRHKVCVASCGRVDSNKSAINCVARKNAPCTGGRPRERSCAPRTPRHLPYQDYQDIRTELKVVFLSLFGLNLAVFIFLFSAPTMWF